MSDITFLSPATVLQLGDECKALLTGLYIEIIEEDLDKDTKTTTTVYKARYSNWLAVPRPKIVKIDTSAVKTLLYASDDYTLDLEAGEVTLAAPLSAGEILRADYFFQPLNSVILDRLLAKSVKEVEVLIHRPIDDSNVLRDYKSAVCKRLYTNVLKNLALEARNYFSISVGGRAISKEQIQSHLQGMWGLNEKDLAAEITQLREWNKTNRFE